MRNSKNVAIYKHNTEYIFGNLTLYNVEEWKEMASLNIPNKKLTFKLELFNNETVHSDLNNLIINVIAPFIDTHRKTASKLPIVGTFRNYFIISFIIYVLVVISLYFIFLTPMISYLNNSIYKTKNLLRLIPMKILASQNQIKTLLKIS